MISNRENLDGLMRNLRAEFQAAYGDANPTWTEIATRINSDTSVEDYKWFSRFPRMREWLDERTIKALAAHSYRVPNRDFEATISVARNDFEDDRLGIYRAQAEGAGTAAALWPDELVYEAVNDSFDADALCHDGRPFFDDAHPLGNAPAFGNKLSARLAADTQANAIASYGAARVKLMEMTDEDGNPMGLMPDRLLVPPALEATAQILIMSDRLDDKPNPYKGTARVTVSPRLTSATAWFLLATSVPLKPFIFQSRRDPDIDYLMDPSNPEVFRYKHFLFGTDSRGAAAYGLPQCAVGSTGTS